MFHVLWHDSGQTNRCLATGRNIMVQLDRMRFRPSRLLSYETMSEEAREVYSGLVQRWHGPATKNNDPYYSHHPHREHE